MTFCDGNDKKLFKAVESVDAKEVQRLIAEGVNVNEADENGETALMKACSVNPPKPVAFPTCYILTLEQKKEEESEMDRRRRELLRIVESLIDAGADVNAADNDGRTVLILAASRGHGEIVDRLIDARADINAADNSDETALMLAASGGFDKIVKILIDADANVNAADKKGITALMFAIEAANEPNKHRYIEIVKLLIHAGANVRAADKAGKNVLKYAGEKCPKEIWGLILESYKR